MNRARNFKLSGMLLAAALLVGCGPEAPKDHLAAANQYIEQRNFGSAVIELKAFLAKTPNAPEARYLLGVALMQQGQPTAALTEFNKAQELGYEKDHLIAKRATALLANLRTTELLREYGEMTLTDRLSQAELQTAIAAAHLQSRRIKEAEAALTNALEAEPNYGWALLNKARIAIHRGQADEAFKFIDAAIATGAINGEAWHMKAALLQVARDDVAGAEKAYLESAKDRRFAELARADLISLYIRHNRLQDIKPVFEQMKKASPQHPTTLQVEAQIAFVEGRHDKAAELLTKLLRVNPKDARLLILAGAVDLSRGSLVSAEVNLGKAIQLSDRQPLARRLLADTYLRMHQPEKALVALRPLIETAKPDGHALALAGEAHLRLGDTQRAEAFFAGALKGMPDDVRLRTAMALTELARGDAKSGLEALEKLATSDPGDVADKALITSYMKRREYDSALAAIDRLGKKKPEDAGVPLYRGIAEVLKGNPAAARSAFEQAFKMDGTNHVALMHLANLDVRDGKPEAARQRLEAAVKARPNDLGMRTVLLNTLARTGATPEVRKAFLQESITALPGEPSLRVAMIDLLLAQKDTEAAVAAARQALSAFRDQPAVLDAAGRALGDSGDEEQAISTFGRAAALSPRDHVPHVRLADIHGKRKNMKAAADSLRKAFELAPTDDGVHRRMLALAKLTGDPSLALSAAKTLQRQRPDLVAGYFIEGDVEAARKNWPAAIAAFKAAIGKSDAGSFAQIRVHDATLASGQAAAAQRFAADWIKAHPKDARFIEHMADIAIRRRDLASADALLRQALAADPKSAVSYNNLAWVQVERGDKDAIVNAEKAYALAPNSPPIMDTLAKVLAARKDFPRAIEVQQRAVAAGGADVGLYRLQLARIYIAAGEKGKARDELDQLAKLGDKFGGQPAVAALRKSIQ